MDDWFQEFKGRTDLQAQDIFEKKTYDHAISLKNRNNDGITKIKSAALTNDDLLAIINGHPNDPQEKRPFDLCATLQKIFKSWLKFGFVPCTHNALKHKKVRHMLGEGGASEEMELKLKTTQKSYHKLKKVSQIMKFFYFIYSKSVSVSI